MNRAHVSVLAGALVAIGACTVTKNTDPPPSVERAGTAQDFMAEMATHTPLLDSASGHMSEVGDLIADSDVPGAQRAAERAAQAFDELLLLAENAPGADSPFGRASIRAFRVCRDSNTTAAEALDALDPSALSDAAEEMGRCTEATDEAVAAVPG